MGKLVKFVDIEPEDAHGIVGSNADLCPPLCRTLISRIIRDIPLICGRCL
jgi:hypothetical protein